MIGFVGQQVKAYVDEMTWLGKSESLSPADSCVDGEGGALQNNELFSVTSQNRPQTQTGEPF